MSEMPIPKFLVYTTLGSLIWNSVLVVIGNKVGENWTDILGIMDRYSHVVLILLIIIFIAFVVYWFGFRKKNKKIS